MLEEEEMGEVKAKPEPIKKDFAGKLIFNLILQVDGEHIHDAVIFT